MRSILAVLLLAVCSPAAFAHALHVECTPRANRFEVEAFYDGNQPARNAIVRVLNSEKQIVYSGSTDKEGKWSFARPAAGKYTVTVADTGHRTEQEIDVQAQAEDVKEPSEAPVGPTREEMSGVPWLKIAIGFVIIGGLGGAFLLAPKLRKKP